MLTPVNNNCMCLEIPEIRQTLRPGQYLRLHRFDTQTWCVQYGWFSFGGNRPWCGWYLQNEKGEVKPLSLPDLYDIYIIS